MSDHDATTIDLTDELTDELPLDQQPPASLLDQRTLTPEELERIKGIMRECLHKDGPDSYLRNPDVPEGSDELAADVAFALTWVEGERYDPTLPLLYQDGITIDALYHMALDLAREVYPDYYNASHVEVCAACSQQEPAEQDAQA